MEDWNKGLQQRGGVSSLRGWVENLDQVLESHRKAMVTSYGIHHPSKTSACNNKENDKPQNDGKMKVAMVIYLAIVVKNTYPFNYLFLELCTYQCYVSLSHLYGQMWGLTKDTDPIVESLITDLIMGDTCMLEQ